MYLFHAEALRASAQFFIYVLPFTIVILKAQIKRKPPSARDSTYSLLKSIRPLGEEEVESHQDLGIVLIVA